jgi:type I restriction enzyme S subunit
MSGRLPEGWTEVALADVTQRVTNVDPSMEPDREFGYVDISAIDNLSFRITGPKRFRGRDAPSRARRPIRPDDVLFSNVRTYLRNIAFVVSGLSADLCSTGFTVLRSNGAVDPRYVFRYVLTDAFINAVTPEQTGTHYPATSDRVVLSQAIKLPPLAEQRRLVARIEALLADVSSSREHLVKVPVIFKRFRQAVLAAACSGRLTEDWRVLHPDEAQPSLPNRLGSPRRTRRGANLSGDELLVDDDLPELPPSWIYARADSVVAPNTVVTYGIVLPGPEVPNGIPYVRQQDISDDGIRVGELRHTSTEIASRHGRSQLQPDDVLLCIIRNLRVAIVPPEIAGGNITQGAVRLRPSEAVMPRFLAMWLKAPPAQGWMKRRYFGMDMPRINVEDARAVPVGLPPVSEQQEIVRRVDALFAFADIIEKQVAAATARADRLTPSILAKAFRGELVPTEAELARREGRDYEPASVLLERIRSSIQQDVVDTSAGRKHERSRRWHRWRRGRRPNSA